MFGRFAKPFTALLISALFIICFEASGTRLVLADFTSPTQSGLSAAPVVAQAASNNRIYFADYSQYVANPILRYWRLNGRFYNFGGPISRSFTNGKGHTVQYFQKAALAYFPEFAGTQYELRTYDIGRQWLDAQPAAIRYATPFARSGVVTNNNERTFFPETGQQIHFGIRSLFQTTGDLFAWGFPISSEYVTTLSDGKSYTVQLFERGRLAWSPETGAIIDATFGKEVADFFRVSTEAERNLDNTPIYNTYAWEHWVEVNLSSQTATYYEGDLAVRWVYVTTGKPGFQTPTGTFYTFRRVPNERMIGGVGTDEFYDLSNVLYTQYFTNQGHALHYAWWREQFGVTGSHGCVNMNYADSEFAWNWLPLGARVYIHY